MSCACPSCFKERGAKVGDKLYVKPEKIAIEGTLPPDLAESLKYGKFEVLKTETDNKSGEPSAMLKMPVGIGNKVKVNGQEVWGWFVFNEDLYGDEEPEKEAGKKPKEKHGASGSMSTQKFKCGDIITTKVSNLPSGVSEAELKKGFRVLGIDGTTLIVEVTSRKADSRTKYGPSTWHVSFSDAVLAKEHKIAVGDWVRLKNEFKYDLDRRLTENDHFHGYKILEIKGTQVTLEMPAARGYGYTDAKHPGKLLATIDISKVEAAPPMKHRKGDRIRVNEGCFPSRIASKWRRQAAEIVEVTGSFNYGFEYTLKLPDDTTMRVNEAQEIQLQKEGSSVSSEYKEGMKVKVDEEYRDDELPDSLSASAKGKAFKILQVTYDAVLVEMPKTCKEAEYDEDYKCRTWWVGKDYLEEVEEKMAKRERDDRSEMSFGERLAANAEAGAVRTVGRKLVCAVKAGILRALEASAKNDKMSDEQIASGMAMFTRFMESQLGNAMISASLGIAIQQLGPQLANYIEAFADDRVQNLADDMQAEGVAIVMEKVVDTALEHILPEVGEVLKGLPPKKKDKKVRVATETGGRKKKLVSIKVGNTEALAHSDEDEEEEEEEVQVPAARSRAA